MIIIRQESTGDVTFRQYDNGISEVVFNKATRKAVDDYIYYLRLLVREAAPGDEILLLNDMRRAGPPPPGYHFSELLKFASKYKKFNASARVVSVYARITPYVTVVFAFVGALKMPRGDFHVTPAYQDGVNWLLRMGPHATEPTDELEDTQHPKK